MLTRNKKIVFSIFSTAEAWGAAGRGSSGVCVCTKLPAALLVLVHTSKSSFHPWSFLISNLLSYELL